MFHLIFKNVGQGDSIILKWIKDDSKIGIGIIDCNILSGTNPILNYVKDNHIEYIDFIVLSHPHDDHFSGFEELFIFCEENEIKIGTFYHTLSQHPAYFQASSSVAATSKLHSLFKKILALFRSGKINKQAIDQFSQEIILNRNLKMKCLSPSEREKDDFLNTKTYYHNEESSGNHPKTNLLSTIFKVYCEDWYFLLTSDAVKSSFIRLGLKHNDEFESKSLVIGQVSHHGAESNFSGKFWELKARKEHAHAVFSVGTNSYNHPSRSAIQRLIDEGYAIHYTNPTGALRAIYENEVVASLDLFSEEDITGNDVSFQIAYDGTVKKV